MLNFEPETPITIMVPLPDPLAKHQLYRNLLTYLLAPFVGASVVALIAAAEAYPFLMASLGFLISGLAGPVYDVYRRRTRRVRNDEAQIKSDKEANAAHDLFDHLPI